MKHPSRYEWYETILELLLENTPNVWWPPEFAFPGLKIITNISGIQVIRELINQRKTLRTHFRKGKDGVLLARPRFECCWILCTDLLLLYFPFQDGSTYWKTIRNPKKLHGRATVQMPQQSMMHLGVTLDDSWIIGVFFFRENPLETKRSILWFWWLEDPPRSHDKESRVAFPLESPWLGEFSLSTYVDIIQYNPMTYDFYTQCTCGQDGSNILDSVAELYKMQIDPMFLNILCSSFAEGCKNKAPTKKKNLVLPSGGQTWQPWWLLPNDGSWLMDLRTIQAPKQPCRPWSDTRSDAENQLAFNAGNILAPDASLLTSTTCTTSTTRTKSTAVSTSTSQKH